MEVFDAQHVSERSCGLQCEENLFDSLRTAGEDSRNLSVSSINFAVFSGACSPACRDFMYSL